MTKQRPVDVPFERVVEEHGAAVLRVCRAMLGAVPGADPDDAWSETFLAALRAYPALRADSNVRGWLVTIAHNASIDQLRRLQRTPTPGGDLPDVAVEPRVTDPVDAQLVTALQALPPKQRGAVVHRYLGDLSYAEIAGLLDCSEAAARRSAADGIARLRATTTLIDSPTDSPTPVEGPRP